jgi:hypothetical protein
VWTAARFKENVILGHLIPAARFRCTATSSCASGRADQRGGDGVAHAEAQTQFDEVFTN